MFVEQILPTALKRLVTVPGDAPLLEAAGLLGGAGTDLVVVCDADQLLRPVILCHPGDRVHDIWTAMKERRLKNIPVVGQDFRPIGVLNARDALEFLLEDAEYEERLLRDYVMCVGYQ